MTLFLFLLVCVGLMGLAFAFGAAHTHDTATYEILPPTTKEPAMKTNMTYIVLAAVAVVGVLLLALGGIAINTYNTTVSQEEGITAVYRDSMLEYDKFWKTVSETAQVPAQYKEDFREVMLAEVDARYEGKDPMMLFVQEKNASLSPDLYQQVQQVIEAGRIQFTESQQTLNDRQRRYRTHIKTFPNNLVVSFLGFPSEICVRGSCGDYDPQSDIDGDGLITVMDYKIVTSGRTLEVFQSGKEDEPLDVFGQGR